ncbi:MAG: hypothetical protein KJZ83_04205 [Burkholderiaceae bacterium]|nr:hypothetical protein [Burkholderiaceae bacterium]
MNPQNPFESHPASGVHPGRFAIPVFFRRESVGPRQHFSPSAHKPAQVVEDWERAGLPIRIVSHEPVGRANLHRAHDARFVDEVFAGTEPNGFGNCDRAIATSALFTCGAMLAAATEAIANRRVAVAPVSGFHHAQHGFAQAFCTFNGLMVAAVSLRRAGLARSVGILDCDHHYGDGTDDIIRELGARWVRHDSVGRRCWRAAQAGRFLAGLADTVRGFEGCDVLLYQAGADPHLDDPLGGWLTTGQLAERDRIVFSTAAQIGLPVAWNLAGGYQRDADGGIGPVLEIHRNTMRECAGVYANRQAQASRDDRKLQNRPS